jgi:hypothetical protein
MREHSMLFKPEMIRLITEGIKTQTRRANDRPMRPGDRIYIKEGHYRFGMWKKNGQTKTGRQKWRFHPDESLPNFKYLDDQPWKVEKNTHRSLGWFKRSPLFMPKTFARHWLEIMDVKHERLHDISEQDARQEGCRRGIYGFRLLWIKINGEDSWNANPMVRAVTFKLLDK